jgi:hypothetical protein
VSAYVAQAQDGWITDRFGKRVPVLGSYWQRTPCQEGNCRRFTMGFSVLLDESLPKHKDAADWLRIRPGGRHYTEKKNAEGLTEFGFPPGQQCFEGHQEPTGKPGKLFLVSPAGQREFTRGQDFNESMNEDIYAAVRLRQRG